ncbi:MAG: CocE/NonD family hydrolase [Marivibrio sp.]|uniref:CocE/NonD family hydrolase n=1 Tax=Marivibrio sp. TaxID=2039719 RepID=UPI0032EED4A6
MPYADDAPEEIEVMRHVRIPVTDGLELSARIWLPKSAHQTPVPAVLEYIPYRKNDFTAPRDSMHHPYFAARGYASVRVDIRGSGDSDGVLADEYLQSELDDGVKILEWLEAQPWCTGDVGMIGISWGGFNGLQIAALQPPQLKAVVSVCSTDDRYADDVHYMGGCLLGDNLSWASQMFAYNSLPPDPEVVGARWRDMWLERLEGCEPWIVNWLEHQRRDEFWRHGSICEDWSQVKTPVMAVSGWADGYSNAVFRLMENLQAPCLGLVGPWSHKYPHIGEPGPAIGFLQECVRFWDHWLKGIDSGIMEEPKLRAWMQHSVAPTPSYDHRPGRWVGERRWPSERVKETPYALASAYRLLRTDTLDSLDPAAKNLDDQEFISVQSPLSTGLFAGKWCSYAATPDLPHDQRQEDGGALVFNSYRLEEDVEILGAPEIDLDFEVDQPVAMVAVRLSDVRPDDKATRVTYGVLNLTHRNDHGEPEPLEPGKRYRARVRLNRIAQCFPAGNRIRVAISTSYWPLAWPAPTVAKLKVYTGSSRLLLPIREGQALDEAVAFEPPEMNEPLETETRGLTHHNWTVERDLALDRSTLHVVDDNARSYLPDADLELEQKTEEWYSSENDDFQSIAGEVQAVRGLRREGWHVRTITRTRLQCDEENFRVIAELDAYEDDRRIFSRNWERLIPRDLV